MLTNDRQCKNSVLLASNRPGRVCGPPEAAKARGYSHPRLLRCAATLQPRTADYR